MYIYIYLFMHAKPSSIEKDSVAQGPARGPNRGVAGPDRAHRARQRRIFSQLVSHNSKKSQVRIFIGEVTHLSR